MIKKRLDIIIPGVLLVLLLLGFNIRSVVRYNKIEDSFYKLYNMNKMYKMYIKKNFVPIEINDSSIFNYIEECVDLYADPSLNTYVVYISTNVCMSCLLSLYVGMKNVGVNAKNIVYVSAINDIQLKREAVSFGYSNFIFDEFGKMSSILSSDIIVFKFHPSLRNIDYIRYDDNSELILELFVQ